MKKEKIIKAAIIYGWIYLLMDLCIFSYQYFFKKINSIDIVCSLVLYIIYFLGMLLIQKKNVEFLKKNKFLGFVFAFYFLFTNVFTGIGLLLFFSKEKNNKSLPIIEDNKEHSIFQVIINIIVFLVFLGFTFIIPKYITNITIYYLLMVVFFLGIVAFYFKEIWRDLRYFLKNFKEYIFLSFKTYIKAMVCSFFVVLFILLFQNGPSDNQELISTTFKSAPIYIAIMAIIYAPIVEELLCRKCLKKIISNKWLYIISSGFIFGLLHVIDEFVANPTDYGQLLYILQYGTLGFFFAKIYYKTNNIFSSIVIHMFQNTLAIVLMLVTQNIL